MVGSALIRHLKKDKKIELITKDKSKLNLINQNDVLNFFQKEQIDQVYIAAAKVGGIHANSTLPAEFIYQNIMIQTNIIHSAFTCGIKKLLFLGTSCIYPKTVDQPMKESALLTGTLEPSNEPYAIAKISGIKLCESYNRQYKKTHDIDYRCIMPTNLYGPGDNYHLENSHVIPALIRRFHEAKVNNKFKVTIWGTGKAKREFLYVDDMASACIQVMNIDRIIYEKYTQPMCSHINAGSGIEITIEELAKTIKEVVNYEGQIYYDLEKPDGNPRKLVDSQLIHKLGWKPQVDLKDGLIKAYANFLKS